MGNRDRLTMADKDIGRQAGEQTDRQAMNPVCNLS